MDDRSASEPAAVAAAPGRAVITGSVGFLGRAFARRLRAEGWRVTGVDVRPGPDVVIGDIVRPGTWTQALDDADLVIHAAGLVGDAGDAHAMEEINVRGTRTVMTESAAHGVRRVLHLSTAMVVPTRSDGPVTEAAAVRSTTNPYVASKLAAEHQALAAGASGLPVTVVRTVHVYGPHSTQWTVRPVELLGKGMFALIDGGAGLMTPTYVDDVVDVGLAAALSQAASGRILNITGPEGVTAAQFFGRYAEMMGRTITSMPRAAANALTAGAGRVLRPLGLPPPPTARMMELIDHRGTWSSAAAADLLGRAPTTTLDEGMAATELWLRDVGLLRGRAQPSRGGEDEADDALDTSDADHHQDRGPDQGGAGEPLPDVDVPDYLSERVADSTGDGQDA